MALIQYSPWTDAAAYGAGLGSTLSQAMLQMPQQRLELAQQAHVQQQRQDIARQQLMQQQQEAQAQQSLGLGQLELHKQELQQNAEQHAAEMRLRQLEYNTKQREAELAGIEILKDSETGLPTGFADLYNRKFIPVENEQPAQINFDRNPTNVFGGIANMGVLPPGGPSGLGATLPSQADALTRAQYRYQQAQNAAGRTMNSQQLRAAQIAGQYGAAGLTNGDWAPIVGRLQNQATNSPVGFGQPQQQPGTNTFRVGNYIVQPLGQ